MDTDKIKNFFMMHGEKIVVAVVACASGYLLYSGLSMPSVLDKHQPDRLLANAKQVTASIDEDHSDQILPPRVPTSDIVQETLKKQASVNPKPYSLPHLLERKPIDLSLRRADPILSPPRAIRVSGHIASIAVLSTSGKYRLAEELEGAEALERVETKQPRPSRKGNGRRGRRGRRGGMDDQMEMMDMAMGGGPAPDMGMGMGMPGMGMPGMQNAPLVGRPFVDKNRSGYTPTPKAGKQPIPQNAWFIAGTAVVPHKEIAMAYRTALSEADGYVPQRDQPIYYNYEIQRADVTRKDAATLADGDWVLISTRLKDLQRAAYRWAGFAPEIIPSEYRDENITGYIPPVLLSDYRSFATHPLIPMKSRRERQMEEAMEMNKPKAVDPNDLRLTAPGAAGNGMGMNMGMGMDMGMGMGMDMMPGGMGMGMTGGMMQMEQDPVDYKIMRFYDFAQGGNPNTPRPGRQYVYRIRFSVQDPNFPANQQLQPKTSTLSADVFVRVQELMAEAESSKKRDFQRWCDWSEPSEPASLPSFNRAIAGPVEKPAARAFALGQAKVEYTSKLPKAKVVNLSHNPQYAAPMPIWMDAITEGSVLSFAGEAEVIDPIASRIKKLPEASVISSSTVIDIAGGGPLKIVDEDEQKEPGMLLIYDDDGHLIVRDQVTDQQQYRTYSFAQERGL